MSGARPGKGWTSPLPSGPVVLVTRVGAAGGSRAAAAALACAASEPDRASRLADRDGGRAPRPTPIATAGARELEQRLAAHLPDAGVAARGAICCLRPAAATEALDQLAAALPLARESATIIHLPPGLLRPLLEDPRIRPTAALLRADLDVDRPLTALAVRDLLDHGLRVKILKHPPNRLAATAASLGALPIADWAVARGTRQRLLINEDNKTQECYDRRDDGLADSQAIWRGPR
jgi:hypothetical protein